MARRRKTGRLKRSDHPAIVYVEWHDSRSLSARWIARQRILDDAEEDYEDCPVSAGFLISKSKRFVILALTFGGTNDEIADVIQIPTNEIRRLKVIKAQRGGRWKRA